MKPITGMIHKSPDMTSWKDANLAEVNIVNGAYFLKVDGHETHTGRKEQIQLFLCEMDAAAVSASLEKLLLKSDKGKRSLEVAKELLE